MPNRTPNRRLPNKLDKLLLHPRLILAIFFLTALTCSLVQILKGPYLSDKFALTHYDNFLIFCNAQHNLFQGETLYKLDLSIGLDYYKYSPAFALFFSPFALLPTRYGLTLWNISNALLLAVAIRQLPIFKESEKSLLLWYILLELLVSMQSTQSNAIIAAIFIFTFNALERGKIVFAAFLVAISFHIKIFGVAALLLFPFYKFGIKGIVVCALFCLVIGLSPTLALGPSETINLYYAWIDLLRNDHTISYGFSLFGLIHTYLAIEVNKHIVLGLGLLPQVALLLKQECINSKEQRLMLLVSIMLWVILFNHKSESPTFIIAILAIGIWYLLSNKGKLATAWMWLSFFGTTLLTTDIVPRPYREAYVTPYLLKVVPSLVTWLLCLYLLWKAKPLKEKKI